MYLPEVSQDTSDAIRSIGEDARKETSSNIRERYMSGTEAANGLINAKDNFSESLGGGPNPMGDAIRSKFSKGFALDQKRLGLDVRKQAQGDHLKKLETATQLSAEEVRLNYEKMLLKEKMRKAKKAARGQILGSVLGIVGGVAGAYFGGPGAGRIAGAMAGQAVGSGVGQAAGGF